MSLHNCKTCGREVDVESVTCGDCKPRTARVAVRISANVGRGSAQSETFVEFEGSESAALDIVAYLVERGGEAS